MTVDSTMVDRCDIVMWSRHGPKEAVLRRIRDVLPIEAINKKILVVDSESDLCDGTYIDYGWELVLNTGAGIQGAAATALENVESEFFISFEDDVLLADNWWAEIPQLLEDENTVVASGVRVPESPLALRKLQQYVLNQYRKQTTRTGFLYAKSLDNTMYKTSVLRKLGGFPQLKVSAGVDNVLANKILENGFHWAVNFDVVSMHLRRGLMDELKHYYWYGCCYRELRKTLGESVDAFSRVLLRAGFSPVRGLEVAYRQRCWQIAYIYPLIRISVFLGLMRGYL